MDFLQDALASGRKVRTLSIEDAYTREMLAIEVDTSLPALRVVRVLERLRLERGLPVRIVIDNGTEFTSKALDRWAYENKVTLHFITPGRPMENGNIERFHGKFREECLNEHWFPTLDDAREPIESWRIDYNQVRPQSALGYLTPKEFATSYANVEKQKAFPTFAQPRRRLRNEFAAKLKPECSHLHGLTEGGSAGAWMEKVLRCSCHCHRRARLLEASLEVLQLVSRKSYRKLRLARFCITLCSLRTLHFIRSQILAIESFEPLAEFVLGKSLYSATRGDCRTVHHFFGNVQRAICAERQSDCL